MQTQGLPHSQKGPDLWEQAGVSHCRQGLISLLPCCFEITYRLLSFSLYSRMPNAGEALCACMHALCARVCVCMHACIEYVHMCVHMCMSVGVCARIAAVLDANGMIICQM